MARNGWMWLELAGNALYWSEIVPSCKNWSSDVAGGDHRWPKMAKNSRKRLKMDINGWMWLEVAVKSGNSL